MDDATLRECAVRTPDGHPMVFPNFRGPFPVPRDQNHTKTRVEVNKIKAYSLEKNLVQELIK